MRKKTMFEFLLDYGSYDRRKIGRFDHAHGFVSTAACSDGVKPFETAVQDSRYLEYASYRPDEGHEGSMVIVESYDTKQDAAKGHDKWVALIQSDKLPKEIPDCGNALGGLTEAMGVVYRLKERM